MFMKKLLRNLDIFLPSELSTTVEAPLLFRGRIVVVSNLISLSIAIILFMAIIVLNRPLTSLMGAGFAIFALLTHLYFLKKSTKNFARSLQIGATIQIIVLSIMIYVPSLISQGMGVFGLIWLLPIFLMMAFYFNTRFSSIFAFFNFLFFIGVCYFHEEQEHISALMKNPSSFSVAFFVSLALVIAFAYLMALLFVHLSEELQREVSKQRDLLVESAKFQSLGQMASNLAHDINNPLFTIQGKLHQMRNLLSRDQLDLERCDKIVESIEGTLLKLSQIVKGISTFAREGRGDQMVSIGVADLIEGNLALAIDRIKNSGIELEIQIDSNANLICYPSFISQVLLNLLNNAIDALENAPVKKIEVRAFVEKDWINITVSDTGSGVPKEMEKKIFEPFFTTKTFGKGTGLGLSISQGLVKVHEGELLYTRDDQKTTFIVRLPSYE